MNTLNEIRRRERRRHKRRQFTADTFLVCVFFLASLVVWALVFEAL